MKGEILMSHPTDRPLRAALVLALGTALIGVPVGVAAAADTASNAEFRLAQAAQKPPPKAQAQPAPQEQGIERQIAELKKRLNITPQQQPQFDAFAQAMRQNAQTMEPLMQEQQPGNRTAVEDLKSAAKFAEAEADSTEAAAVAIAGALRHPVRPAEEGRRPGAGQQRRRGSAATAAASQETLG